MSEDETRNLRRSSRRVSPKCYTQPKPSDVLDSSESEFEPDEAMRPELLFNENEDLEGQQIFAFRTPKKRNALANLAENAKTPKVVRQKLKQGKSRLISLIMEPPLTFVFVSAIRKNVKVQESSSGEDFSASESDFSPVDESDDEETANSSAESVPEEPRTPVKGRKKILLNLKALNTPKATKRGRKPKDAEPCVIESENYFQTQSKNKALTSNHTLDRLKTAQLPQEKVEEMLRELKIGNSHQELIQQMFQENQAYFQKWLVVLNEGFNVLLYGLGSKRNLINSFHKELIKSQPVVIVNGFFPGLTIQDILNGIATDILEIATTPSNPHEAVAAIERELVALTDLHIFLLVHNIDGPNLRVPKVQDILSRLARVRNIHLIASVDHINAPLMWDHSKLSNYNFMWFDVTTMEPYWSETKFETSVISKNSGNLVLSSMRNVFQSLTSNSKAIYRLIVSHQLENKGNMNYQGMSFKELYASSRDSFLVSSDIALRAQLTEFTDHKLVRLRRAADGMEYLTVPIQNNLLEQFLEENRG